MQYDCPKFKINKVIDIDSITSIHYFEFGDDFIDSPESHEPWELVYVDRGECNIIAGDKTLLPFNTPDMHGLKIKSSGSLWGGPQSVLLRLELMLIEIVRDNHYYENKHKRFFPKEIIVDEFALKIISFMEERIYHHSIKNPVKKTKSFNLFLRSIGFKPKKHNQQINLYKEKKRNERFHY